VTASQDIADLILELRQRLGLTQEQFAARLGVTFPTVNRWENRRAKPSRIALKLIKGMLEQMGESGSDLLMKYFPG
jgi:DNA-binding transcriptional regulator YiaG